MKVSSRGLEVGRVGRDGLYRNIFAKERRSIDSQIDSPRNVLRPTMAIDGHRARPVVVDNICIDGQIAQSVYCPRHWPSMDAVTHLLWWPMPIDWQRSLPIVYRNRPRTSCCQVSKYNCCRQYLSVDAFHSSSSSLLVVSLMVVADNMCRQISLLAHCRSNRLLLCLFFAQCLRRV